MVLVAVLLARWVWVFAAPAEVAMPATASWQRSDAAANLFGQPLEVDAGAVAQAAASNYKLVGVFAHRTAGFAVLLVDGKQVGAGLGAEIGPGMRLVETGANFVLLERGGVKQRVELQAASASSGITAAGNTGSGFTASDGTGAPATAIKAGNIAQPARMQVGGNDDLEHIPPEQRALMQQELENFRRRK